MDQFIFLVQVVTGVLIIIIILLQQKGAGLGSTFGGEVSFYRARRGAEKLLFYLTMALVTLFLILSLLGIIF